MNTVQQESQLRVAMVAKTAIQVGQGLGTRPAIITAGECGVFFAYADSMARGLKFTVEEWDAVVDFVNDQLLERPEPESWEPDWSRIDERYNYYAVDQSGRAYAYKQMPYQKWRDEWCNVGTSDYEFVKHVTLPKNPSWDKTLRIRPGV